MMIELKEKVIVSRSVDNIVGWEDSVIYEPVWMNTDHIESMCFMGHTIIHMVSGKKHEVQATPQEIMEMLK